jgi:hypothetical protein
LLSTDWDVCYNKLVACLKGHGEYNVPKGYKPNPQLATWVGVQRQREYKGYLNREHTCLTVERLAKLDKLDENGFQASICTDWDDRFEELWAFQKKHDGHC